MLSIAKSIYSVSALPQQRQRKLKVICLGLPRSGTESLHDALQIIGFNGVSHGFDWWLLHPNTSMLYCELMILKLQNRLPPPDILRRNYFDRILADKEATTDVPAAWFATELVQAYPEALVVLNRRRDVGAWKRSFRASVLPMMQSWKYWFGGWFNAELFWGVWLTDMGHDKFLFRGDFEGNAEKAYTQHYEELEKMLQKGGRKYLDWSIEDGWAPLCRFLDREEPSVPFPNGNIAAEFGPRLMTVDEARFNRATRNFLVCLAIPTAIGATLWRLGL